LVGQLNFGEKEKKKTFERLIFEKQLQSVTFDLHHVMEASCVQEYCFDLVGMDILAFLALLKKKEVSNYHLSYK